MSCPLHASTNHPTGFNNPRIRRALSTPAEPYSPLSSEEPDSWRRSGPGPRWMRTRVSHRSTYKLRLDPGRIDSRGAKHRTRSPTLLRSKIAKSLLSSCRTCARPRPGRGWIQAESPDLPRSSRSRKPLSHNGFRRSAGSGGGTRTLNFRIDRPAPPTQRPLRTPYATRVSEVVDRDSGLLVSSLCPRRRAAVANPSGCRATPPTPPGITGWEAAVIAIAWVDASRDDGVNP